MKYNKLVRDKIPEIIKNKGITPITHIASDEEYQQKLKAKLQEEVNEFLEDNSQEELADILEVIYALCNLYNFDKDKLEQLRKDKAEKRGKFKDKIILDETKE
ncbi:MAG TPA: phosphoribosyl-ATP pyrophosphohydrolase [Campylobacterales bacterium]|nr:phosphoribosyl-ATP pyrophosphohydrolase [Campylobacterales bacterium]